MPTNVARILVALSVFAMAWPAMRASSPPGFDREIIEYAGMALGHGATLYADVFDNKPPLIYLFSWAGSYLGPWGFLGLLTLLLAAASDRLQLALARRTGRSSTWAAIFCVALLYSPAVFEGGGLSRHLAATWALFAVSIALNPGPRAFHALGALSALALFTQPETAIPIGLLALGAWIPSPRRAVDAKAFALFVLAVAVPILFGLVVSGAARGFVEAAIQFNFSYVQASQSIFEKIRRLFELVRHVGLWPATAGFFALFATTFAFPWIAGAAILQLALAALSPRFYGHYLLPFTAYLGPGLVLGFDALLSKLPTDLRKRAAFTFAATFILLTPLPQVLKAVVRPASSAWTQDRARLVEGLRDVRGIEESCLVWGDESKLSVLTRSQIRSPTRWFSYLWKNAFFDPEGRIFAEFLGELRRIRPARIVDATPAHPMARTELQRDWARFTDEHYETVLTTSDGTRLLALKARAPQ